MGLRIRNRGARLLKEIYGDHVAIGAQRKNKRGIPSNRRRGGSNQSPKQTKKGLWFGVGAAALSALLFWNGNLMPNKENAAAAMLPATIQTKAPVVFAHTDQITGTISTGETLAASLRDRGLSATEIESIREALRHNFDFRLTRAGDTYKILRDQKTGQIASFSYQRSPIEVYSLSLGEDQKLHASLGEVFSGETSFVEISLEGSLRGALEARPDGENIARLLSSALSWQLDLHHMSEGSLSLVFDKSSDPSQPYQKLLAAKFSHEKKPVVALWYTDEEGRSAYVDEQGRAVKQKFLRSPLQLVPVEQKNVSTDLHQYWATPGTPVIAVADGEIIEAKDGKLVIEHPNGVRSFYENITQFAPGIQRGILVNQQRFLGTIGDDPTKPAMLSFHVEQEGVVVELGSLTNKGAMFVKDQDHFKAFSARLLPQLNK
jgi:murein DD-endopeptidase MepM/ murein hydrolase activator NlpD